MAAACVASTVRVTKKTHEPREEKNVNVALHTHATPPPPVHDNPAHHQRFDLLTVKLLCLRDGHMRRGFKLLPRTSISGWSVGTFMEVAVLLEPTRAVVRSGVPMKKASAPSARQARAKTLVNIIFDSGREEKRKRGR